MGRNTQGAAREASKDSKDQLMGDFGYTASNVTCLIPRAKTEAAVWLPYRRASWATASWAASTASAEECAARTEASSDCSDSSALQQRPDAEGRLQPGVGACKYGRGPVAGAGEAQQPCRGRVTGRGEGPDGFRTVLEGTTLTCSTANRPPGD